MTYNVCLVCVSKRNDFLHEKQMQMEKDHAPS